ncbi:MAG: DUF4410 domain-containing protein [Deltaproteobacteria bacterium]|jgi:hypothetical protein|nr:DUF4410 domain-containing protein [Deltaproteobacteria bacterium]
MKKTIIGLSVAAIALFLVARASGRNEAEAGAPSLKPARPGVIYVADFVNHTLETPARRPRILNRPRIMQEDPQAKEARLVAAMSNALTGDLRGKSIPAVRLSPGEPYPHKGWLVQGTFVNADEGSRVARTMVGFGAGSTNMQIQVSVTDLGSGGRTPFAVFGANSKTGMMPGAVITKNPYVAAGKFVMSKMAPERDVKKTARQIADAVAKLVSESSAH